MSFALYECVSQKHLFLEIDFLSFGQYIRYCFIAITMRGPRLKVDTSDLYFGCSFQGYPIFCAQIRTGIRPNTQNFVFDARIFVLWTLTCRNLIVTFFPQWKESFQKLCQYFWWGSLEACSKLQCSQWIRNTIGRQAKRKHVNRSQTVFSFYQKSNIL